MYLQSTLLLILLLDRFALACIWVVLLLELICLPDVLELIGLESMHYLLTDSIRLQIHLHVALNHCSKSVTLRSLLGNLNFYLIFSFFLLFLCLLLPLCLFASRYLESHLNFLFDAFLKGIYHFIDMHLGFGLIQGVFFIGKRSLSINCILLSSYALVLDQIAHSDNHLDCLNCSEKNQ